MVPSNQIFRNMLRQSFQSLGPMFSLRSNVHVREGCLSAASAFGSEWNLLCALCAFRVRPPFSTPMSKKVVKKVVFKLSSRVERTSAFKWSRQGKVACSSSSSVSATMLLVKLLLADTCPAISHMQTGLFSKVSYSG